jgi:hypothetical protein
VSVTRSKASYRACRDGVTDLVEAGEPFGEVEEAIEHTGLDRDEKDALWLLAFSERDLRSTLPAVVDE